MKELITKLQTLGLTDGEAKTYLALLHLGPSTVGPITKKTGIAYSNIYSVLERLKNKGLASVIIKQKTQYFQAASPNELKEYIVKKEIELKQQKKHLDQILPNIKAFQHTHPEQEAEVFTGRKGLRAAFEKLITEPGNELLFFYIHKKEYESEAALFYKNLTPLFKGKPTRGISNEAARNVITTKLLTKQKIVTQKYVTFPLPGTIDIHGDNILLITWEQPITAVLIRSASMANNMRQYFETVWKRAKT